MEFNELLINQRLFINPSSKVEPISKELGYLLKVNDKIIINCDYKPLLRLKNGKAILQVDTGRRYCPKTISSRHIGFDELPNFALNLDWYGNDIDGSLILKSWNEYKEKMNLDKMMSFLIYRDVKIMANCVNSRLIYPLLSPSWDVCLFLPYYMKLCEKIPGHEIKLNRATEVIRQINNIVKDFYTMLQEGQTSIPLKGLDDLLRKAHSISDELAMAYRLSKLNFDIKFGNPKSEPDYIINGLRVEHKSKFPDRILSNEKLNIKRFKDLDETQILCNMVGQLTSPDEGFERDVNIFINNITRMPIASELYGLSLKGFRLYPDINSFEKVISTAMDLAEKERIIIPYISPICSRPRIISFPLNIDYCASLAVAKI